MIWLDRSPRSIVVGCTSCSSFRVVLSSPAQAEAVAQAHLQRCHDETAAVKRAVKASQARQRRSDTP